MRSLICKRAAAVLAVVVGLSPVMGATAVIAADLPDMQQEIDLLQPVDEDGDIIDSSEKLTDIRENADPDGIITEKSDSGDTGSLEDETVITDKNRQVPPADTREPDVPITAGRVMRLVSAGTGMQKNQHIYFGRMGGDYTYRDREGEQKPCWRILDPEKDNAGGSKAVFVLSERLWGANDGTAALDGRVKFNSLRDKGNAWATSDARDWCGNFLRTVFSDKEQAAVRAVTKYDEYEELYNEEWYASGIDNDKVFFLSVRELHDLLGINPLDYPADYLSQSGFGWWLRSPCKYSLGDVKAGQANISTHGHFVDEYSQARPAFNISLSSVLFVSAAADGKESGSPGENALTPVKGKGVSDWKLTVKDRARKFSAKRSDSKSLKPGGTITLEYSGAGTGSNEYVSAALCNSEGTVLYYGRLVNDSASGTARLALPKDLEYGKSYKLYVYSEQYNGNYLTDLASEPSVIDLSFLMNIKDTKLATTKLKYNGSTKVPAVKNGSIKLKKGTDYTRIIKDSSGKEVASPRNVGTYKMYLTGKGNYYGTVTRTYKIVKGDNPLSVSTKKVTHNFKKADLKSKSRKIRAAKLYNIADKGAGKRTYTLSSARKGSKSYKSRFTVNEKDGSITVKKGLGTGTYKLKIKVKAAGNKNYNAKSITLTYNVKVAK